MATFKGDSGSRRRARWIVVLASVSMVTLVPDCSNAAPNAPDLRPSAPTGVSAVSGNRSAILRWTSPSSHGSKIIHYRITPYQGTIKKPRITVGHVTTAKITGLRNGQRYTFRIAAVNAHGDGPAGSSHQITVGTPLAPTGVSAQSVSGGMNVSWKVPSASNGSKITSYVVTPHLLGVGRVTGAVLSHGSSRIVPGLMVAKNYTFTVAAKNKFGTGDPSRPSRPSKLACVGAPLVNGQADINAAPEGTTFCLSGTHNWTLSPKSGDQLIGPAVLDGQNTTAYAIRAWYSSNVVLSDLEIRKYKTYQRKGAIEINGTQGPGWILRDLRVHDNGALVPTLHQNQGGWGAQLGDHWQVLGGRYYNNRQGGLAGGGASGAVIESVELDHNNFTNDSYTTRNVSCGDEAGGMKWAALSSITIRNSKIHDNACKGLWADGANNATIVNNHVYNNWDEGIYIEISTGATITGNTVYGNGFNNRGWTPGSPCLWMWGGGITIASSGDVTVAHNDVHGNCNGITGTQQNRGSALLQNVSVHDNTIAGPGGTTGAVADNGADLTTRNIVFANNRMRDGMKLYFCPSSC